MSSAADASARPGGLRASRALSATGSFGSGGTMGPDLTGGQRTNLAYLLENIIDPGAEVSPNFKMSIVATTDGRVLTGIVVRKTRADDAAQHPPAAW